MTAGALLLAQATEASIITNPYLWLIGFLGTTVGTLLAFILKEQNKKLDTQTGVLREVAKGFANLGHRFKSLEMALSMEVVTRPNVPEFIRKQLESKLRKRVDGDDTRDEAGP